MDHERRFLIIRQCIDAVRALGFEVIRGSFGTASLPLYFAGQYSKMPHCEECAPTTPTCCPLTAVALVTAKDGELFRYASAKAALEMSGVGATRFLEGYDGEGYEGSPVEDSQGFHDLGQRVFAYVAKTETP